MAGARSFLGSWPGGQEDEKTKKDKKKEKKEKKASGGCQTQSWY